jgi:hypothetical protein
MNASFMRFIDKWGYSDHLFLRAVSHVAAL